jgi:hypothetical protein
MTDDRNTRATPSGSLLSLPAIQYIYYSYMIDLNKLRELTEQGIDVNGKKLRVWLGLQNQKEKV